MASQSLGTKIGALYERQAAALEPELRALGISWGTFELLAAVQSGGPSASQAAIAQRLGITPASLSESVFAHVNKGLLLQEPSMRDRRVKELRLSSSGEQALNAVKVRLAEVDARMEHGIADADLQRVSKIVDRMLANLSSI